jgi:hypothetical protein
MNGATLVMINCEHGLGALTAKSCGMRWGMANGRVTRTAHNAAPIARMKRSACKGCKAGEARCTDEKPRKRGEITSRRKHALPVVVGPMLREPAPEPIALPAMARAGAKS